MSQKTEEAYTIKLVLLVLFSVIVRNRLPQKESLFRAFFVLDTAEGEVHSESSRPHNHENQEGRMFVRGGAEFTFFRVRP